MKPDFTPYVRAAAQFSNIVQQLEDELKRMKEKKVAQEFVDKKDLQIEELVNFYNTTDELITCVKNHIWQLRMENHFLTEMLCKKVSIQELMDYKPSKKILLINQETAEGTTLSELNG